MRTHLSATMIKFLPLDFLVVSHRIQWKNKNTVYHLQISALVLEIFKFKNCVKYANETPNDVIHSTQFYIKYKIKLSQSVFSTDHWNLLG